MLPIVPLQIVNHNAFSPYALLCVLILKKRCDTDAEDQKGCSRFRVKLVFFCNG